MPEYLAPGVYVEEVSYRSKSIEGVATSTTGFVGLACYGPGTSAIGASDTLPSAREPRLVTSFTEFERVFGGLAPIVVGGSRTNYLAHAARVFFLNGGKRLYVARVIPANAAQASLGLDLASGGKLFWRARWPGKYGNVTVVCKPVRSGNVVAWDKKQGHARISRATVGSMVEVYDADPKLQPNGAVQGDKLALVTAIDGNGTPTLTGGGGPLALSESSLVYLLDLEVIVVVNGERQDRYAELSVNQSDTRFVGRILEREHPQDEDAVVYLDYTDLPADSFAAGSSLLLALTAAPVTLDGGLDGDAPAASDYQGKEADPDDASKKASGLAALGEIDDIAIVAIPDAAGFEPDEAFTVHDALVAHCASLKYRIGIIDGPQNASLSQVRAYRGRFDSKYAALYHPWIEILDPTQRPAQGAPPQRILLPPSGFVAGIYARTDIERGVHKAPANEIVYGLTKFEFNINKARQEVLNPEGINALRFFEGRGNRVWGARTLSSDPEWKYVNVRRLFIFLEHSIDKSTQWAVFEPNNERLWANMRHTIEDFLLVQWRNGALMGTKPEEAFFVRCDRTTMTQNDLDNGRLIVLIGVAPVQPAEFVIFRIGQWTGQAVPN